MPTGTSRSQIRPRRAPRLARNFRRLRDSEGSPRSILRPGAGSPRVLERQGLRSIPRGPDRFLGVACGEIPNSGSRPRPSGYGNRRRPRSGAPLKGTDGPPRISKGRVGPEDPPYMATVSHATGNVSAGGYNFVDTPTGPPIIAPSSALAVAGVCAQGGGMLLRVGRRGVRHGAAHQRLLALA